MYGWKYFVDGSKSTCGIAGVDIMTLNCEVAAKSEGLEDAIAKVLRDQCRLKGRVALVPAGSLANDGKIIDDLRDLA